MLRIILLVHLFGLSVATSWLINGNFQYLLNAKDKVIWDTAVKNCKKEGAELLILTSQSETQYITSNCQKCRFWLNLGRDSSDQNKFAWTNGNLLDTKIVDWAAKEPRTGDCVEIDGGSLFTMACDDVNGYVCKKKYIPPTTIAPEPDPCGKYTLMADDGSRASQNDIQPTLLHCDHKLKAGWYRLQSSSGNTMPITCVPPLRCGTLEPIWMQGALPSISDGIVSRKACVSSGDNCCTSSWDIKVKKCTDYYVYYLLPIDKCFKAYCIGITKPQCKDCDNGKFPTLTTLPALTWRIVNSLFEFVCDIKYELKTTQQFYFEVQWFADRKVIYQVILGANKLQAILEQKYLIGNLGTTITVSIRGKFGDGPWSPVKISLGFFAGIKITTGSAITLKPGGDLGKITFQLTLPLICPPGVTDCSIKLFTGLEITGSESTCSNQNKIDEAVIKCPTSDIKEAFCGIIITNKNWNLVHEISIAATIHSQLTSIKTAILKLFTLDSAFALWGQLDININIQISITGLNIINNICSSLNDPHMRTFDNMHYEHHLRGTFVLYRNKRSGFEVQAYYNACPGAPKLSCNCAVAILSSDMLIVIDRCGKKGNMDPVGFPLERSAKVRAVSLPTAKANQKGTIVYRLEQGRKYQIIFPTGTYVEVTQSYGHLINIAIRASAFDISVTEGLCGTFNGNIRDDFTLIDGSVACKPGKLCAKFSKNWEVSIHKGGLFQGVINVGSSFKEDIFCKCKLRKGKLPEKSCDFSNNIQICQSVGKGKDITSFLKKIGIIRKRSTDHDYVDDNDLDDDWELRYLKKRKKREVKETNDKVASLWTEEEAQNYCRDSLQKSSAGQFCNSIPNVEFDSKIDFCILDIMASKSTQYVPTAVEAVKEECTTELNRNVSLWVASKDPNTGEDIFIPPPDIEGKLCINDCSNRGSCEKGLCKCIKGFAGGDCSIKSDEPPEVYYIPQGGLCDKNTRQCWSTAVNGLNFIDSDQLTCHLETVSVNMPYKGYNSKSLPPVGVKGFFESFGEVRCPTPVTAVNVIDSWIIYISNDGKLKSNDGALFTAYNSDCIECKPEGMCKQKENTCAIRGKCFQAGQSNPATFCQKCRPENSLNQWTPDPDCFSEPPPQPSTPSEPPTQPPTPSEPPTQPSTPSEPPTQPPTPSEPPTQPPTPSKPPTPVTEKLTCPTASGIYPHLDLCTHYIICKDWNPVSVPCENGLVYNPRRQICDIPARVPNCSNGLWN